jgi:hypothetical protein
MLCTRAGLNVLDRLHNKWVPVEVGGVPYKQVFTSFTSSRHKHTAVNTAYDHHVMMADVFAERLPAPTSDGGFLPSVLALRLALAHVCSALARLPTEGKVARAEYGEY